MYNAILWNLIYLRNYTYMYIYLNDYRESRELNFFLIDVKIKQIKIIVEANSTVSILFYIFQLYFQH